MHAGTQARATTPTDVADQGNEKVSFANASADVADSKSLCTSAAPQPLPANPSRSISAFSATKLLRANWV